MPHLPANPTVRRVVNVAVVGLCTASSLLLLGAVRVERPWDFTRTSPVVKSEARSAVPVEYEADLASVASDLQGPKVEAGFEELLQSEDDVADVAPSALPAALATTRAPIVLRMEVTAYCPCTKCCGPRAQGITASGKLVDYNGGRFVAADTRVLPFGRKLVIPGYADDAPVEVIDRGGAIKGHKLDLYFPTHAEALLWGRQQLDVTVYE